MGTTNGAWIALKPCGCCVGCCRENGTHKEHNDQVKLEWLGDGLIVRFVTSEQWQRDYYPEFLNECPHVQAADALTEPAPDGQTKSAQD